MNDKKRKLKKVTALVSALSLTALNYSNLYVYAKPINYKTSAGIKTAEVSEETEKEDIPEENKPNENPEENKPNESPEENVNSETSTTTTITVSTSTTSTTTTSTTTTTTSTTTTTTISETTTTTAYIEVEIDNNYCDLEHFKEAYKSGYIIEDNKIILNGLKDSSENKYCFRIEDIENKKVLCEYVLVDNKCGDKVKIENKDKNKKNILEKDGKQYIKYGTTISDYEFVSNIVKADTKNLNHEIKDQITIYPDSVWINRTQILSFEKIYKIKFNSDSITINNDEENKNEIDLTPSEMEEYKFSFILNKTDKGTIQINGKTFYLNKEYTMSDFLREIGSYPNQSSNTEIQIQIEFIPTEVTVKATLNDKATPKDITLKVNNNNKQFELPRIIEDEGKLYYLSYYIKDWNGPQENFDYDYEGKPEYFDYNSDFHTIAYNKVDESDVQLDKFLNSMQIIKRNDNTITLKQNEKNIEFTEDYKGALKDYKDALDNYNTKKDAYENAEKDYKTAEDAYKTALDNYNTALDNEALSSRKPKNENEPNELVNYSNFKFRIDNEDNSTVTMTDDGMNVNLSNKKYVRITHILDDKNHVVTMNNPLYIYIDTEAPNVTVEENSKDFVAGTYSFNLIITDDAFEKFDNNDENKIKNNENIASIKEIQIGDIKFTKNVDGNWTSSNENKNYNIKITPNYNKNSCTFNCEFSTKNNKGDFNSILYITVTDYSNNNNKSQIKVNPKVDNTPPSIDSIRINGIKDGINKGEQTINKDLTLNYNNDGNVSYNVSDRSSGVDTVNLIYENNNLKLTVTDKVGNPANYYYSKDATNNVTTESDKATTIIIDQKAPTMEFSIKDENLNKYEDVDKKWYNNYPDIKLKFIDDALNTIKLTVNDTQIELKTKDIIDKLSSSNDEEQQNVKDDDILKNLTLHFEPDESDNQKFKMQFKYNEKTFDIGESELKDNGELNIKFDISDYASNTQSNIHDNTNNIDVDNITFYVDNNGMTSDGKIIPVNDNNCKVLSFGTFANKQFDIKVKVEDVKPSSGIKYVKLIFNNEEIDGEPLEDGYYKFSIPKENISENSNISSEMTLKVEDNVGNTDLLINNEKGRTKLANEENSKEVMIENINPNVSVEVIPGDNNYHYRNSDGQDWYSSDVTLQYTISDNDSCLASVKIEREGQGDNNIDVEYKEKVNDAKKYDISTNKTGENKFKIEAEDNAGNKNDNMTVKYDDNDTQIKNGNELSIYKDNKAPEITKFDFYSMAYSRTPLNINDYFSDKFGYFFGFETNMTVTVEDPGDSSGLNQIVCILYDTNGKIYTEYSNNSPQFYDDGKYRADFTIPEGFKGDIKVYAVDNVKNKSKEQSPDGLINENKNRHDSMAKLEINLPETEHTDKEGLPLYNTDVTAHISVVDDFSGIRTIEWITSENDTWSSVSVDDNGNLYGNTDGWHIDNSERNVVLSASDDIIISRDSNNNFIKIKFTDNSGNISEKEVQFSIDKQPPVISVSGITPSQDVQYFNSSKNVDISITERNFSAPKVTGASVEFTPSAVDTYSGNTAFEEDGEYSFEIENTDLAGNVADKYSSGKFVIDKTAPESTVVFKGKDSKKEFDPSKKDFINEAVNMTVTINEVNFSGELVNITINGKSITPKSWESSGNGYEAVIPYKEFEKDGKYTVKVSGSDLAGNPLKSYSADFTVDTTAPEIEFSKDLKEANGSDFNLYIEISDDNLIKETDTKADKDGYCYGIKLTRNGKPLEMTIDKLKNTYTFKISEKKYITGSFDENSGSRKFKFDAFPKSEDFDGLYILYARASDEANNSNINSKKFSVNRNGSIFTVENLDEIKDKYLNEARDIVIHEINVDKHEEKEEIKVILDKGSTPLKLEEGDYEISEPIALNDGSGYEYIYKINKDNFDKDLKYKITIETTDATGRKNLSDKRGADFEFYFDREKPTFSCDGLSEKAKFNQSEKIFRINAQENLKHIKVTTSFDEVLLDIDTDEVNTDDKYSFEFTMPAMNKTRSVTVELTDFAGNVTTATYDDVLITENILLYLLHKTWFKVTGVATILGIGISSGFVLSGKKKRRRQQQQQ